MSKGRAYLESKLQEQCGLSRRQAVLVVNTILERMIFHLRRGRDVDTPFGTLMRVRRYFGQQWDLDDDWPANRDPYTIEYLPPVDKEQEPSGRKRRKFRSGRSAVANK